jgi:ABC-type multidrug transport system fused ATPase/permease subunit
MADAIADQPDLRGPLRYLCWLARCQLGRVLLGAGYGSAWMVTLALPPYLLSKAIDEGLRAGDTAALWRWAGALLGVGIVNAWLAIGRHRTMSLVRIDANFRTTRLTVGHVTRLGAELPRRVSAGEVVTVGLGDVTTIAAALTVAGPGVGAVIAYAFVGFLLWTVSWLLAVVVLLGVPALVVLVGRCCGGCSSRRPPTAGRRARCPNCSSMSSWACVSSVPSAARPRTRSATVPIHRRCAITATGSPA